MKKNRILMIVFGILMIAAIVYAAKPSIMTAFPSGIWVGATTATATYADGVGDVYIDGDLEVNGTIYDTGERSFNLPLVSAFLDGTGVMGNDGTTAPGMAEKDGIPAIVYGSSGERTKCQWTFRVPSDYSSGLGFRVLLSASGYTPTTATAIDWQLWVNDDGSGFDAAAIAQDAASATTARLDLTNEVVTLLIDSTGATAISAGSFITVDIWNLSQHPIATTTEIKGIQAYYTASR